ncbi:recombinase family protein [Chloroflexota bacterium]
MKRAVPYCRVSTEDQEREGTSLQTQLEACLKYCKEKGYQVIEQFTETMSGLTLDRPKLDALRDLVRDEQIDIVVIYSLDRLSRNPNHGVIIQNEFEKYHVTLEAVTETVDGSRVGKLMTYIRQWASEQEIEDFKDRSRRGKKAWAKKGVIPHGGFARLYGYDYSKITKKRTINETEAYWVKQMYGWLVNEPLTTNAITYRLRELKAPTKHSRYWNRSSVLEILKNPAYTGRTYAFTFHQGTNKRKPQDEWIEIPGATPVIISEESFEAAQVQLRLNQEKAQRNTKQQYLLRSHLYCRQCGRSYCGHIDRVIRYYRCPGKNRITSPVDRCSNKNLRADKIEALVWEKIEAILDNPKLIFAVIEKQRDGTNNMGILESELQQVQRRLKALDREQRQLLHWAVKNFPEEMVTSENKRINQERNILESRIAELEGQIQESLEATISIPKMEEYIRVVQEKLTTLDFDMKRLALDMLNIKVWIDGQDVEVTGTIPIEDAVVVTKSSLCLMTEQRPVL